MMDDAQHLAKVIGARVRRLRLSQQLTLDQLSDRADISRRALVNVEQGAVNPSVGTLLQISDALGIGLPSLVAPPSPKPVSVTRAGDGPILWTGEHDGRGRLVAGTEPPDVVELWDWSLGPGDRHASEAHSAGTKELIQVREGQVILDVSDQSITLNVGDAVSFPGDVTHAYANPGAEPAAFVLAVFEPGVGSTTTEVSHG